ncbi:MAG: class II aldolase/adducin family protein, partial [Kosmotogaceae bacterium]
IFITPSGYSYEKMTERDISVIDFEGNILEGERNPSSEWKMHVAIYKARKDVEVILHTHPTYSSIASVTLETVPSLIEDSAMICGPEINVAEYADPGSWELANNATKALGENGAVILKNHGLVNVGKRFSEAFTGAKVTEKNVQVYIEALKIGKEISYIPDDKLLLLRKVYRENYLQ